MKENRKRNLIGERVRSARRQLEITQTQLAKKIQASGMYASRIMVCKIETGYREVTDVELMALAKALGVRGGWLLGEKK